MRGAWFIVLVYNLSELFCSILYLNKMADEINHWNGLRIWHGLYACSVSTKLFNNYKFYFSLTFLKSRVFETKWQMSLIFEMDWDFGMDCMHSVSTKSFHKMRIYFNLKNFNSHKMADEIDLWTSLRLSYWGSTKSIHKYEFYLNFKF